MNALMITTEACENTIDGVCYNFTRNAIDYTIFRKDDCVEVWKSNRQRMSTSSDCFWNGVNDKGRPMAKFLQDAMTLIAA